MNRSSRSLLVALLALGTSSLFAGSPATAFDQGPKVISAVQPARPHQVFQFGTVGNVDVTFTITAEGAVADVKILHSTDALLDESALNAIKQWKFTPAMKHGQPVAVQARQTFKFESQYVTPGQMEAPEVKSAPKAMIATAK